MKDKIESRKIKSVLMSVLKNGRLENSQVVPVVGEGWLEILVYLDELHHARTRTLMQGVVLEKK